MKNQSDNSPNFGGAKQKNDPRKNDPTKQDERDNDATRIRPEKTEKEKPAIPPDPSGTGKATGVEEPATQTPYKRTPSERSGTIEEPDRQQDSGINQSYNPASPRDKRNDTQERSDTGDAVM